MSNFTNLTLTIKKTFYEGNNFQRTITKKKYKTAFLMQKFTRRGFQQCRLTYFGQPNVTTSL